MTVDELFDEYCRLYRETQDVYARWVDARQTLPVEERTLWVDKEEAIRRAMAVENFTTRSRDEKA